MNHSQLDSIMVITLMQRLLDCGNQVVAERFVKILAINVGGVDTNRQEGKGLPRMR